jgi:hypothetical protein
VHQIKTHRLLTLALGGLLVAAVVATVASTRGAPTASAEGFDSVSTRGTKVVSSPAVRRLQRKLQITNVFLIGRAGDRAFYRFAQHGIDNCYGVGEAQLQGSIQAWACGGTFSALHPVQDFSVVEMSKPLREWRVLRSEGIAADGVARVVIRGADGGLVADMPVHNNVYFSRAPAQRAVAQLQALDSAGKVVYTTPLSQ